MLQLKLDRDCAELGHSSSRQKVCANTQRRDDFFVCCFVEKIHTYELTGFLDMHGLGLYHPEVCHLLKQEDCQLNYTFNLTFKML